MRQLSCRFSFLYLELRFSNQSLAKKGPATNVETRKIQVQFNPFWTPHFRTLVSVGNKGLITLLESALTEISLANPFRIRTYKKHRGRGTINQNLRQKSLIGSEFAQPRCGKNPQSKSISARRAKPNLAGRRYNTSHVQRRTHPP